MEIGSQSKAAKGLPNDGTCILATYPCDVCGAIAATVVLFRSSAPPERYKDKALKRSFATLLMRDLCGASSRGVSEEDAVPICNDLNRVNVGQGKLNYTYASGSFCPTCDVCYCRDHWTTSEIIDDDGYYDKTIGVCPKGHRHMLDD